MRVVIRVSTDAVPARVRDRAPSSRCDEAAAGWYGPSGPPPLAAWERRLAQRKDPKWDTFSWVTVRVLLEAVNHLIIARAPAAIRDRRARYAGAQRRAFSDPATDSGRPGSFAPDFTVDWTALSRPRFLIAGDPGEADASQYAVIDPLLDVHRGGAAWEQHRREKSDFMVVLSDVIYPSGDVNDYLNGFYVPFRDYDRPIYALPGNHDWYDGLRGFMYHFCGAEPPPAPPIKGARLADRIAAALWRRAAKPDLAALQRDMKERDRHNARRRGDEEPGPGRRGVQPASYFVLELANVRLVAIDTGVTGELDAEQGEWLLRMSAGSKPKVLLTGKPLLTGDLYRPGPIAWREADGARRRETTVDDIVRDPAHHYVAAIGGDSHNYQRFPVRIGRQTIQYIVAGGSGAHLGATHAIPTVGPAPEQAAREERPIAVAEQDFRCYPLRGDSLALFCRRMGPLLFKLLVSALLVTGAAALLVFELISVDEARRRAAAPAAGGVAAAVLLTVATRRAQPIVRLVVLAGVLAVSVAALISIADTRATVAVAVTLGVLALAALALVIAYALRGRVPKVALDTLALLPLVALPAAIWAEYDLGAQGAALAYVVALAIGSTLVAPGRRTAGPRRAAVYRAVTALAWLGLAAVVVESFGERWLSEALLTVLALLALVGIAVPRLGPGRRRAHRPRHDTVGPAAGAAIAVAVAGLALVGLERLAGGELAAVVATGIAAVVGVLAALVAAYLLLWLGLADPRALRRLRTGRISPKRAAEYVAETMGTGLAPARPAQPARWVPGEQRTAAIVARLGRRVSPIADTNEPPFFKSFLSVEVENDQLIVSCYGVTGYDDPRRSPALEDRIAIPLTGDGGVNDVPFDCTPAS